MDVRRRGSTQRSGQLLVSLAVLGLALSACSSSALNRTQLAPTTPASSSGTSETSWTSAPVDGNLASRSAASVAARLAGSSMPTLKVQSVDLTGFSSGFALAVGPCGASSPCTDLYVEHSNVLQWSLARRVSLRVSRGGGPGVSQVFFATPKLGWLLGPDLWITRNTGRSWIRERVPGGGGVAGFMRGNDRYAFLAVQPCFYTTERCQAPTQVLERYSLRTGAWRAVGPVISGADPLSVAVAGSRVGVVLSSQAQSGTYHWEFLLSADDGEHFHKLSDPCGAGFVPRSVSLARSEAVGVLCDAPGGFGSAGKRVFLSTSDGRRWSSTPALPPDGDGSALVLAPSLSTVVASSSARSWLFWRGSRSNHWTTTETYYESAGWNDLQFDSTGDGCVVHGGASVNSEPGELLCTTDAGREWGSVLSAVSERDGRRRSTSPVRH